MISDEVINKVIGNGEVVYVDWITGEEIDIYNPNYSYEIYSSKGFGIGCGAIVKVIPKKKG